MTMRRLFAAAGTALLLSACATTAPQETAEGGLAADHVVIVMRHGVRPPTKDPALPPGYAADPWPAWPVPPGWLTPHGAAAIGRLGQWDAAELRRQDLLPATGCPADDAVSVIADSDQRTIATAESWLAGLAPGCKLASRHRQQGEDDPAFSPIGSGTAAFDPKAADAAVAQALGPEGIAGVEARQRPLLARLDAILCGKATSGCGVSREPSTITPARPRSKPGMEGALDRASTAAQILLLEYADGKPLNEVGWGRASAADVGALSEFHALEFRVLARPRYLAAANFSGLLPLVEAGLSGAARVTMISGHDTNVANLGGLLDVHWHVPALAADDPVPGGGLVLTRMHDGQGRLYVRVAYRSQTLGQIRSGADPAVEKPYEVALSPPGCSALGVAGLCTLAQFESLVRPH